MTHKETVILARFVKAACPQQAIDKYTPDAWHDLLGDLDLADCRTAATAVAKRQPFVAPAEIRAEVQRVRDDRIARALLPVPDVDPDKPARTWKRSRKASSTSLTACACLVASRRHPVTRDDCN